MNLSIAKIEEAISNNLGIVIEALFDGHYEEYKLKSQVGSEITLEYLYPEEGKVEDITLDLTDAETILKIGYHGLISLAKKLNLLEPLPEITSPDLICARMINFAKDVMSPILDSDDYEVRLTDGDGGEDSYYIVCFMEKDKYKDRQKDADSTLSYFKVIADTNVIFQLDRWPKAQLNLTGSHFHSVGEYSEELLRGIFLSHYYFANVKFED